MVTKRKPVASKKVVEAAAKKTPTRKAVVEVAPPVEAAVVVHPPKQKLVRDSFTMPKLEYDAIAALKTRLIKLARPTKKGELLRAGIGALAAMSDAELRLAVERIPSLKTGRPKKTKTR